MAWYRLGTMLLPEPILIYCQLDQKEYTSEKFCLKLKNVLSRNCISKCRQQNANHDIHTSMYQGYQVHIYT